MCSEFWTIKAEYDCPMCGVRQAGELQTHWHGAPGSFFRPHELGERVPELRHISAARLDGGSEEGFISVCDNCGGFVNWGAHIENEAVVSVWPVKWEPRIAHAGA